MYNFALIMKYVLLLLTGSGAFVTLFKAANSEDQGCHKNQALCQPEQIHIAFGEKINDITVTWSTMGDPEETLLKYGQGKQMKTVIGEKKLFVDGGTGPGQWIHNVRLTNLKYNSTYEYSVGSKFGWSKLISFKTPPAGDNVPIRAVILGDMGIKKALSLDSIIADVKSGQYDLTIHVGDFAYNLDDDNGKRGDKFMNMVQPFTSVLPYMVCVGNHEWVHNYTHYRNRFSMPGNTDNMYYSFDIGPVHFIALDTETYYNNTYYGNDDYYPDNHTLLAQYAWLENDLNEANKPENRKKRPWIVTYGHRPFYCSDTTDPKDHCRYKFEYPHRTGYGGLEPLLKINGVDLEIWGHEHSYERMWPLYNKTVYNGSYEHPYVNPGAPVQITSGSAGCHEERDHFYSDPAAWSAFRSSDYGYTRLTAHNKTHLYVEELSTGAPLDTKAHAPKKIDEFWLIKDHYKPKFANE